VETETQKIEEEDDSKIIMQTNIDRRDPRPIANVYHLPGPLGSRKLNKRAPTNAKNACYIKKIVKFLDISNFTKMSDE
jgi:hypothetical protein